MMELMIEPTFVLDKVKIFNFAAIWMTSMNSVCLVYNFSMRTINLWLTSVENISRLLDVEVLQTIKEP